MGSEFGIWRVDDSPTRLEPTPLPLESQLEAFIESDSTLLGAELLIIGRQVPTTHGKFVDLLALDAEGTVYVLELKRDKTPRDVVAQILDYGSWVEHLDGDEIRQIYDRYNGDVDLDSSFGEKFGTAVPDELNSQHVLTIIAGSADASTERIVVYLNSTYGVPINVAFFQYFEDEGHKYLARTWLVDDSASDESPAVARKRSGGTAWNGTDWYVSFGEDPAGRSWADAVEFGFVSAGGGAWYSRTLQNLPVGARIFTCIPSSGYVGVGVVTGPAQKSMDATLVVSGVPTPFADLALKGNYRHAGDDESDELAEYLVPIEWTETRSSTRAFWKVGMFANQNSACKLRNQFTIEEITREFDLVNQD